MTVLITLTTLGIDTGPLFNLSSSPDGTTFTQFATGIAKLVLEGGYSATVPDGTTTIRVTSTGVCTNYEDITISGLDCGLVATAVVSTPATTTSTTTSPSIPLFFTFVTSGGSTRNAKLYINNIEVVDTSIAYTDTIYVYAGDQIKVSLSLTGCTSPDGAANVNCTGIISENVCNQSGGAIINSSTYTVIGTELTLTLYCVAECDNACA